MDEKTGLLLTILLFWGRLSGLIIPSVFLFPLERVYSKFLVSIAPIILRRLFKSNRFSVLETSGAGL